MSKMEELYRSPTGGETNGDTHGNNLMLVIATLQITFAYTGG